MSGTEPGNPPASAAPQPSSPTALDNLVASMGMAQLLVVGGAALIVVVDLILGVLLREYSAPSVAWAGAAAILLAFLASRMSSALPFRYETALLIVAAVVAAVLVRNFVIDLLVFLRPPVGLSAPVMLGLVLYALAGAAMAWGAWQLWRGRR